jgi:hypothetical protein
MYITRLYGPNVRLNGVHAYAVFDNHIQTSPPYTTLHFTCNYLATATETAQYFSHTISVVSSAIALPK